MTLVTKVCTGPAHHGPTQLPMTEQYWPFHRSGPMQGMPTSRCKLCVNWAKLIGKDGPHGLTPSKVLVPLAKELLDRCGSYEAVKQAHGIGLSTLKPIVHGNRPTVQKKTAARILQALSEQRKYDRRNGSSERFRRARVRQAIIEERADRMEQY